jgi:gliding motility-associated protein GldE
LETETQLSAFANYSDFIPTLSTGLLINIILVILLVFVLALISGAEVALFYIFQTFRTKPDSLRTNSENRIIKLTGNPDVLRIVFWISKLFFTIILFIVIIVWVLYFFIYDKTGHYLVYGLFLINTVLYIVLIEILPKSLASANPEKYAKFSVYFVGALNFVFSPLAKIIYKITSGAGNSFYMDNRVLTANEIASSPDSPNDVFSEEEEIFKGIVKFGNIDVGEILKPRVDVVAIDFTALLDEVLKVVVESEYSRIPVYSGNFDNIKGVLYVKDLLPYINEKSTFRWQTLIRPPYFVPESKKVKELLTEFQSSKIHMAIVVDEYGGTIGIVTLEDVLEEIVGEISDESDDDEKFYTKFSENTYLFDAKIMLNDFYKILKIDNTIFDEVKGEADTLAGLILELKGEIPAKNEEIVFNPFIFKIEAADSRRIKQIRVTINNINDKE